MSAAVAGKVKCTYLGNCPCPKCAVDRALPATPALPRLDFEEGDGGYIPMKSSTECSFLVNCTCNVCADILDPLQEYIAAFMEKRPFIVCNHLPACICLKCDTTGEAAFKLAEEVAERILFLANAERSSLMSMLAKSGPTPKFQSKLAGAYSEELRKTAKRMKKDLELRKKYVFDAASAGPPMPEPSFENFEAPKHIVVPPENESNSAGAAATAKEVEPPTSLQIFDPPASAAAATQDTAKTPDLPETAQEQAAAAEVPAEDASKVLVVEKDQAVPSKEEEDQLGELPDFKKGEGEGLRRESTQSMSAPEEMSQTKRASTAYTDAPADTGKKKGGLFFLLPKKMGKFKFAQRGREILWMRNLRPVVLKGEKIAYPKLESVTMVICNDIMFLAVHQTQITESQTYVLVHRPLQRDETRAEELNPELGGVYFRILMGKQEFIVQATSKTEMAYWVRTINQRRGFKPTAMLISTLG